jgi:hypothetical protein
MNDEVHTPAPRQVLMNGELFLRLGHIDFP